MGAPLRSEWLRWGSRTPTNPSEKTAAVGFVSSLSSPSDPPTPHEEWDLDLLLEMVQVARDALAAEGVNPPAWVVEAFHDELAVAVRAKSMEVGRKAVDRFLRAAHNPPPPPWELRVRFADWRSGEGVK